MISKRHITAIDSILVVMTIASLLSLVGIIGFNQPLAIEPVDDLETTERAVLFTFKNAETIEIDENPDFTSPTEIHVRDDLVINLESGEYYWKVRGLGDSEVRQLTIVSEVALKLRSDDGDSYRIVNAGNTPLEVEILSKGARTGSVRIPVDEEQVISGTRFIGREDA